MEERQIWVAIDHPARFLLCKEPSIRLLNGRLAASGAGGLLADLTPQDTDRFAQDRLAIDQGKPNAPDWAMKDLNDLCLVVDAKNVRARMFIFRDFLTGKTIGCGNEKIKILIARGSKTKVA